MSDKKYQWWTELNQFIDSALGETIFLLKTGFHLICPPSWQKNGEPEIKHFHKPDPNPEFDPLSAVESVGETPAAVSTHTAAIMEAAHICSGCGADIITRAHSRQARTYGRASNVSFHDWMANDIDRMDLYGDTPHPSGFEQNVAGLKDEHLQRVEQYWFDHQLRTTAGAAQCKSSCCATIEQWEQHQSSALE